MTTLHERVHQLRASGLSMRAIAREVHRGYGTVHKLIHEPLIVPPPPVTRQCAWIENDRRPWLFCQEAALPGEAWCEEHRRRVYTPRSHAWRQEAAA